MKSLVDIVLMTLVVKDYDSKQLGALKQIFVDIELITFLIPENYVSVVHWGLG